MKQSDILIIGQEGMLLTSVQEHLSNDINYDFLDSAHLRSELKNKDPKIILLLHKDDNNLERVQYIQFETQGIPIIFIHELHDFELFRNLVRAGATDYLVFPEDGDGFEDRILNIVSRADAEESTEKKTTFKRGSGKVFAFYSGKGGSGKTFLSTSFAQTLKLESTAQVVYIDLNLQFGGGETFLGVEANRTILDFEPVINEISEHHLRNVSEKERFSKMDLLISPRDAEVAERLTEEFVTKLLRACRRTYDFIIVDLPAGIDERSYGALIEADKIYYTTMLDTPSIRVMKHVEELFQKLGIPVDGRLELVINEAGRENELSKKDLERFVSYPVAAEVRRDIKGVQAAINKGQPIRKEVKEKKLIPAAKDIRKWVRSMLK
ncbi:AAA family ATPase [Jeotgalibacillus proteolyticus]|uniref:Pilus assembly protein CpaE n=1 Tax=Jeotgalibacillus proteolyticus TaxID=2082395 RepID=A0A2S5G6N8_9BACL|nr:AAA family ATPase [Jeotgalibacillus proteolyticus]PPA68646.1 pilus assembly protein CpaE [Jeotgalibacillus proteolyticus]